MAHTYFLESPIPVLNYELLLGVGGSLTAAVIELPGHETLPMLGICFDSYMVLADRSGRPFGALLDCPSELLRAVKSLGRMPCGIMSGGNLVDSFPIPVLEGQL